MELIECEECKIGDIVGNKSGVLGQIISKDENRKDVVALKIIKSLTNGIVEFGDFMTNVSLYHGSWKLIVKKHNNKYVLKTIVNNQIQEYKISTIVAKSHDYFEGLDENNKLIIISTPYILEQI